jgi:preprotein translocase subunit SecD
MATRRSLLALGLWAAANAATAKQSALLDGIYLVIDEGRDDAAWVRYRRRDEFEAVLPELLMALRFAHAEAEIDKTSASPVIVVELTSVDRERFGRITSDHVGERLAVIVDGFVVTAPIIVEPIRGGHLQFSGDFNLEEAAELARRLVAREESD